MLDVHILELSILYTSVKERLERLQNIYKVEPENQLRQEIEISKTLLRKISEESKSLGYDVALNA